MSPKQALHTLKFTLQPNLTPANLLFLIIIIAAFAYRFPLLGVEGSDYKTYDSAITSYLAGRNPYQETIASYKIKYGDHGYAYLPGLLNIFSFLTILGAPLHIPNALLWQLPLLVSDFFIGIFIYKHISKYSTLMALLGALLWFFNPYILLHGNTYTHTEPISIALLLVSLVYLAKNQILSGGAYALSILVKTLPALMVPMIFTIPTFKKKLLFVAGGLLIAFLFCLPFMRSVQDFQTMITGSLLVHGERGIQGRPLPYYVSYTFGIEALQLISFQAYSYLSIIGGWIVFILLKYVFKLQNLYLIAFFCFGVFTLLTPVFNRSYSLWVLPFMILGLADTFSTKHRWLYYLGLVLYVTFFAFYFNAWDYGFHQDRPGSIINI